MIIITSKKDGFRRCGKAHAAKPTEYQNNAFSKKTLAVLQAEPMLVVVVTEDKVTAEPGKDDKKKSEVPAGK